MRRLPQGSDVCLTGRASHACHDPRIPRGCSLPKSNCVERVVTICRPCMDVYSGSLDVYSLSRESNDVSKSCHDPSDVEYYSCGCKKWSDDDDSASYSSEMGNEK